MAGAIVVAGGSGGIGSAIVRRYLDDGLPVTVVDRRPPAGTPDAAWIEADVTSWDDVESVGRALATRAGGVDHLVSLAGGALDVEFGSFDLVGGEAIDASVRLNLTSHLWLARVMLPLMAGADGLDRSVVVVSSINALRDFGLVAYSSAKAGLLGFVTSAVGEFGRRGVRVNAVLPGTVRTPGTDAQPKRWDALERMAALGRLATPADVADATYALTHVMTSVTGQWIAADGGQSLTTTGGGIRE